MRIPEFAKILTTQLGSGCAEVVIEKLCGRRAVAKARASRMDSRDAWTLGMRGRRIGLDLIVPHAMFTECTQNSTPLLEIAEWTDRGIAAQLSLQHIDDICLGGRLPSPCAELRREVVYLLRQIPGRYPAAGPPEIPATLLALFCFSSVPKIVTAGPPTFT